MVLYFTGTGNSKYIAERIATGRYAIISPLKSFFLPFKCLFHAELL